MATVLVVLAGVTLFPKKAATTSVTFGECTRSVRPAPAAVASAGWSVAEHFNP